MPTACPLVVHRLRDAWNAHDLAALADCLHPEYDSAHPLHPERNLRGRAAAQHSWGTVFENIPDLRAELRRYAVMEDTVWTEWLWQGTHTGGAAYTAGGVIIFGLKDEVIVWARVYTETLHIDGPDFDRFLNDLLHER